MTAATAVTGVTSVTAGPRVLAIMGSGETAPAMAKVHRALFERFGGAARTGGAGPVAAAIIDTPYGFQENADELSARTMEFFATSVGNPVEVASYRSRHVDGLTAATALARIRSARYVMAGPGSPSYALGQWEGGPIPGALAEKLSGGQGGGVLTMASAAALTLGVVTIPVYEIYKVGEAPRWLPGLDLLGVATGLRAAVVPHYDNAEGGSHDTRFCYMGERRLRMLEAMLPDGTFVLGVDSHTALLLDLEAGTASVTGLGGVTVRVDGRSTRFAHGSTIDIEAIGEAARALALGQTPEIAASRGRSAVHSSRPPAPLLDDMANLEGAFVAALEANDTAGAVSALLDLDEAIATRVRAGEDSPDLDNASATFRSLIVRLGEHAATGSADPRAAVAPLAEALIDMRAAARAAKDWEASDRIRDRLAAAGIEVRDSADGASWVLTSANANPAAKL